MTAFIVHAMPAGDADPCASATRAVVAEGREPCRRCLRNARPGENLLLLPYDPFPMRSGVVFLIEVEKVQAMTLPFDHAPA